MKSRSTLLLTTFLITALLLLLISAFTPENHHIPWLDRGKTQCLLEFTITPNKTTYKLQEPIQMNTTLRNIGEENVTITFLTMPNPNPYWFWRVYNENQQPVFYHEYTFMLPALEDITLQPGEFMQSEHTWNQKATYNGQQVPSGIYYLTAAASFIHNEEEVILEAQFEVLIEGEGVKD